LLGGKKTKSRKTEGIHWKSTKKTGGNDDERERKRGGIDFPVILKKKKELHNTKLLKKCPS